MVVSSTTVTFTVSSGASGKLMTPSRYVHGPKGPSLVPSGRRSMANVQSPSVPHFPTTKLLGGLPPLAGVAVWPGASVLDEETALEETVFDEAGGGDTSDVPAPDVL